MEQMAVILYNFAVHFELELPSIRTGAFYDEADFSSWAANAIITMFEAGVINGMGNNRFNPQGYGTRAEVATLLRNFLQATQTGPFVANENNIVANLTDNSLVIAKEEENELSQEENEPTPTA